MSIKSETSDIKPDRCRHGHTRRQHPSCFSGEGVTRKPADNGKTTVAKEFQGNIGIITTRSADITTLDEALEYAKVDLITWEVDRYIVNSWEVTVSAAKSPTDKAETYTNFQVKVWLKRKKPIELALDLIVKELKNHKIKLPGKLKKPSGDFMLEVSLFDAHFGKLCWEPETGNHYDLKIAEEIYTHAVTDLVGKSGGWNIEKILFPVGQDFFHINSPDSLTPTNKNLLQTDGRLPKIFQAGFKAVIKAIDYCLGIAPVEILWIPGNHDPETSYYLTKVIEAYYHGLGKAVTVDSSPTQRKYVMYGSTCLMFAHSPTIKQRGGLPLIMAGEQPEMWGRAKHREIHTGHYHKASETDYFASDTFGPVRVRVLPSLSGTDVWHYEQGYVKTPRSAEAYLWHKEKGYEGHFSSNWEAV